MYQYLFVVVFFFFFFFFFVLFCFAFFVKADFYLNFCASWVDFWRRKGRSKNRK